METKIHSFESFGTVDGPGIRFVVFFQGCPMRCLYCHNPDTWLAKDGKRMDTSDIVTEVKKYRSYFKNGGGVSVSGGDPLFQLDALIALFQALKKEQIHTCVDTSGALFQKDNPALMKKFDTLLSLTDLFLLDIKHIDSDAHKTLCGTTNTNILDFARYLDAHHKPVWIRHVLVPNYTTDEASLRQLRAFIDTLHNVEKVEVLPYHRMGEVKYKNLGYTYPLENVLEPTKEMIKKARDILCLPS